MPKVYNLVLIDAVSQQVNLKKVGKTFNFNNWCFNTDSEKVWCGCHKFVPWTMSQTMEVVSGNIFVSPVISTVFPL